MRLACHGGLVEAGVTQSPSLQRCFQGVSVSRFGGKDSGRICRLRKAALDALVDVDATDGVERYRLVARVHYRQVFDVLEASDGDSCLHPAGAPVGEVVPSVGILVDSVGGVGVIGLDHLPGPRPGEVGEVALPLGVLVAVDSIEHAENGVFLHGCKDYG